MLGYQLGGFGRCLGLNQLQAAVNEGRVEQLRQLMLYQDLCSVMYRRMSKNEDHEDNIGGLRPLMIQSSSKYLQMEGQQKYS